MWPERLSVVSVFLLVTACLVASNLERPTLERHSWLGVFAPLFVLQGLLLALLLASCFSIASTLFPPPGGGPGGGVPPPGGYVAAGAVRAEAAARRKQVEAVPDVVWGSAFLALWFVWTLLLGCKLNAVDDAFPAPASEAGGPSWGAVFGVLIAAETLLLVFWLVTATMNCVRHAGNDDGATPSTTCGGSLTRCRCAHGCRGSDPVDVVQEAGLYLLLVGLVLTSALWLGRVESAGSNEPSLALVFVPVLVPLGALFVNGLFLVLRLSRGRELCYDWTVTLLYVASVFLLFLFLCLFASAADGTTDEGEGEGEGVEWHGVFVPLYVLFSASTASLCLLVVSCSGTTIRRALPGVAGKWGPLVYDDFGVPDAAAAAAPVPADPLLARIAVDDNDDEFDRI